MWYSCPECFPKRSRMGTARLKQDEESEEEGYKREVSIERSKAVTKKISPNGLTIARAYRPTGIATPPSSGRIT